MACEFKRIQVRGYAERAELGVFKNAKVERPRRRTTGSKSTRFRIVPSLICAASCYGVSPAMAQSSTWGTAGTVATGALVGAALGLPALHNDRMGDIQAAGSMGVAFVLTQGLKQTFPDRRPDGSDAKSFPSGHASLAFAAAATLQNRNGWQVGIPAQLVAAFVAVSRVKAKKHAWDDVAVGAAIGEVCGFAITSKPDASVRVMPWGSTKGGGVGMAMRF